MYSKMIVLLTMSAIFFGNLLVTNHAEKILSFLVIQPTGDIYVGDQVQLQCVFSGFNTSTDTALIYIIGDSLVLATDDGTVHTAPQNVQSPGIQQNSILSVTINDIDVTLIGIYTCRYSSTVFDQEYEFLTLDVLVPPPICSTAPTNDDLIFNDMDEIRLTCISETGNPQSMLFWNLQSETPIVLPIANISSSSISVTSNVDLILSTDYDGSTFTCLRDLKLATCSIGPLQVRSLLPTTDTQLTTVMTVKESSNGTAHSTISTGLQSGVIVAIVLSVVVIITMVSVAIIVCIRSRHLCDKIKSNTTSVDNSHDNPHMSIDNHGGHSSAEGENYTSLQKNTLEGKSAKLYQDLLPVPRSPNNHDVGDQRTNVGMVSLEADEPDYVVKSVSHKTMNASKHDSEDYEDVEELPGETYEEIPEKCYEEIPESRTGISPIPAAAQEPKSDVQHVYLDFTGEIDANEGAPEVAANTPDLHDQSYPVHVNLSNEVVYANQTRVQDFK